MRYLTESILTRTRMAESMVTTITLIARRLLGSFLCHARLRPLVWTPLRLRPLQVWTPLRASAGYGQNSVEIGSSKKLST
jgi:hypothetical protein